MVCHALSSVSGSGGSTGIAIPVSEAVDSPDDIMLPSYIEYDRSCGQFCLQQW